MRRREISPEFWTDERIWNLDSDAARLLLPGLWQIADREGRQLDEPFKIGAQVRPWAPREAAELIDLLVSVGLVARYEVAGRKCLALPPVAWKRYQRPHPKEAPSQLPDIPQGYGWGVPRLDPTHTKVEPNRSGLQAVVPSSLHAFEPSTTFAGSQKTRTPPVPRESDFLVADFLLVTGKKYKFQGAKDGVAFAELRKTETIEEIRIRWQRGLRATGWHHVASVAQLLSKWNDLAVDPPTTGKLAFGSVSRDQPVVYVGGESKMVVP